LNLSRIAKVYLTLSLSSVPIEINDRLWNVVFSNHASKCEPHFATRAG